MRVRLIDSDRSNVVGLSVIVPRDDLHHVDFITHGNDLFHSSGKEPVVASVDPVFVITVDTVVLHCFSFILLIFPT